jgi:uncharacterized tellurite resistance protein B-like protein
MKISQFFHGSDSTKRKIRHLKILIAMAHHDNLLLNSEKEIIIRKGAALGISASEIETLLSEKLDLEDLTIKKDEDSYALLKDLIEVSVSDRELLETEYLACLKIALNLGFDKEIVDTLYIKSKAMNKA